MHNHVLESTADWFQAAVPEPTGKNLTTQIGVHFEEVTEMLASIEFSDDEKAQALLCHVRMSLMHLAEYTKNNDVSIDIDPTEMLDSLADQLVTGVGVAHMLRMDIVGALNEVNLSNFSKFVDGIPQFDANRKIIKGPDYFKPNLELFLFKEF